jgi:hypothetical protein
VVARKIAAIHPYTLHIHFNSGYKPIYGVAECKHIDV